MMSEHSHLTYGRLRELFKAFSYDLDPTRCAEGHSTYVPTNGGLPIILPNHPDSMPVWIMHISMIKHVLRENDSADAEQFERVLLDPSAHPTPGTPIS